MLCLRCQSENPLQAKFCLECGARLTLSCGKCRSELPAGAKFCPECGEPLAARTGAEARFPSPESYIPRHLAEKILTSKSAVEGERKQVTVLFADLKGSMELLADRDPEEARKLLDPVLERMMEAVHRYEGTVKQEMGDGIMALFGAPVAHEDHGVRACYAALRMQRRVNLYADEIQRGGGAPVQIRVGLNSGEVVVRSIGNDLHMDYTAVGQTTHLAARMEQMAKPGSVLVTGETLKLVEGYMQVRPLGAVTVKGLETATPVYELTGIGPARSRLQASAARGLTRFVGRDTELQRLAQALERTAAGHGQAVAVVGEAGVGKSRLVWEFTRSHRTHGWLVVEGSSVSYGKATPYLPVIDLLRAYFRIQDRDEQREIRERVAGKLLMLDRALEPLPTPLLALLDVPVDDEEWGALDPPQRRQRALDAVKRLLLRESQVQPLLVLFEDLHWIDSETQALLDGLIESLPTARVLLLVNYRPEYQHAWGRKTYYLQLRIDPLPPESAEELLNALLGQDRTVEPLKRLLIERSEGNPFFLEESVQALVETQMLLGERGAYRMAKAPGPLQIPATAQAIVAARIDRLPSEDKRLLQGASVIGKDVPFTLLQAIADVPEDSLHRGLTGLQAAEFLYETSLFPDIEYTFKHALTHEVAYGSVLLDRRRALHPRIVRAIEGLYPDRLAEHIERLADHAFRGEEWGKAVTYLRQAGAKAVDRSASAEAVAFFEQALAALQHLPETREVIEQAIDLRRDLRTPLTTIGEFGRLVAYLRQAETLAETLGDQRRLGQIFTSLSISLTLFVGDSDRGIESGQRALALGDALGDLGIQVGANYSLGLAHFVQGDHRRAIVFNRRNVDQLQGDLIRQRFGLLATLPAVLSRALLGCSCAELGEFRDAIAYGEDGIRTAEVIPHPFSQANAETYLGYTYLRKGDLANAIRLLEHALMLGRTIGIPFLYAWIVSFLGAAYAMSGRLHEAFPLLEEAVETGSTMGLTGHRSLMAGFLSEAYLLAGRVGDASELAERVLDSSRKNKERGYEAWTLRLLGAIHSQQEPAAAEAAEEHYRQALALAGTLGMRPLVAHCHLGLGKLYRRTDKPQQAQEHLTTATTMYREMDMTYWLEQAEAELGELA